MKTQRPFEGLFQRPGLDQRRQPAPQDVFAGWLDEDEEEDEGRQRRPWLQLIVALIVAILAIYFAGQTAARLWLEDLDKRLIDAGAGTNADAIAIERQHLAAYRALAYADGFGDSLRRYDARDIEQRLAPVDANHGVPMIDIIDNQGRVVFAFRAEGAIRPIYRERRGVALVQKALKGERDEYGDRFTDLIATDEGPLIATGGPVRVGDDIVGALLVMTPLDELLSQATNFHGSSLTAYSLDRGDPMATTTPIRPRTFPTALRVELAQLGRLPYTTKFNVDGVKQREIVGALILRHRTQGFLGAALPDRSRYVAWRVMIVVAVGLVITSFLVAMVAYAWGRRYEEPVVEPEPEPLALPEVAASGARARAWEPTP